MDLSAAVVFLTILSSFSCQALTANLSTACPFNSLCKCTLYANIEDIPHYKSLKSFNEISCNDVPFTKLPDIPHYNVTKLSIVGCGLEILEDYSLGNMKLKSLSFANNNLMMLSPKALFPSNETLQALDFSYNSLHTIPEEMINGLLNLKILSLESNSIASLKANWGNLKNTLQSLFLGKNELSFLQLNFNFTLSNFRQMISLNIDNNFLTSLEENSLPFSLKSLSVEHNLIDNFPSDLVDNLKQLQKLNLKDNYIRYLPIYSFKSRQPLMYLDLSNNLLTSVTEVFGRTIRIDDLDLSYNQIGSIPSKPFNGLSCSKINLSHNKITSLSEKAFYGLSYTLESLDLTHNILTKFPKALTRMKKLKYLSLKRNYISSMPDRVLRNSSNSLNYLSLSHNSFHSIPKYALRNLKKLTTLSCAYNKISSISSSDFSHWGDRLQSLSLSSNRFSQLENNVFKSLPRLLTLKLPFNTITTLNDKAFANLNNLQMLDLGYSLRNITFQGKTIKTLSNLRDIYLDNNRLSKLPEKGIDHLRLLTTFNADFNELNHIPSDFFKSNFHINLMDVRFSFNKITYIDIHTFSGLKSLKYIALSHNQITTISAEAFKNLPSKLIIILSYNKLINIGNRTFMNLPNLAELDLHSNDLKDINWQMFDNVTSYVHPMTLNLSHNRIENTPFEIVSSSDQNWHPQFIASAIHIEKIDLSHNNFRAVPFESLRAINSSLKIIDLGYNYIKTLHNNPFLSLSNLEILNLEHNMIDDIRGSKFEQLSKLQILDLSHNHISTILADQFSKLNELRVLDLSNNYFSALPGEVFKSTKLERLILKGNQLVSVPSQALVPISHTLGILDLANNKIQNMEVDQFTNVPMLTELNLCSNSFTHVRMEMFRNLNFLLTLRLCSNRLAGLEYFQHFNSLRNLDFADSSLKKIPFLEQVNLVSLNLSNNVITELNPGFLFGIPNLRKLDLSHNNITTLINPRWNEAENLNELDLSSNPIEVLTSDSFFGLRNLKVLNVQNLHRLKRFDADTLSTCKLLVSLKIQSWPNIEKYRFRLPSILSNVPHLKKLHVKIIEDKLTDQLVGTLPPKLKVLEVTGENLTEINGDALKGLHPIKEMLIRFTGTNITTFPPMFFTKFINMKATIDLRGNNIRMMGPESFYKTPASLQYLGTQAYSGGIHVQHNYLMCGCEASWMGQWLRRYIRETLLVHTKNVRYSRSIYENMLELTCLDEFTGANMKLISYEQSGCYVSRSAIIQINSVLILISAAISLLKIH